MESALDVLSRAATMVQDNANENRLTSKELPTTAWRRDRRSRTGEYHNPHYHQAGLSANSLRASPPCSSPPLNAHIQHSSNSAGSVSNTITNMRSNAHHIAIMMAAAASARPVSESTNHPLSTTPPPQSNLAGQIHMGPISRSQVLQHINAIQNDDVPLDMSVGNLKQRNSPPPPYREPLPGSQFASSLARPSVITQAPPKRDIKDSTVVTNRENDNRSCESIDEHFRRSLGNDYFSIFSKRSPASQSTKTPSPQPNNPQPSTAHIRSSSPTMALSPVASTLPPHSNIPQTELIPLPGNHQLNSHQVHQNQILAIPKGNTALLSPAVLAAQMKITPGPSSPPLSLVVRPNILQNHQHNLVLQKSSSLTASAGGITPPPSLPPNSNVKLGNTMQTSICNMSNSKTASPLPSQKQSAGVSSVENTPSSSPHNTPPVLSLQVPNCTPNIPTTIIRIKTEPGLQNVKPNNQSPPASPTSTTDHNMNSNFIINTSNSASSLSPKTSSWKPSMNSSNTSAEVVASVDDHFAKALGDTWIKLQENKEIRK